MCHTRILSWKEQTLISQCEACQVIYIWHNNFMLTFSKEQFCSFKKAVNKLAFYKICIVFPDGEDRVILHTPDQAISFTFEFEEFELFKETIAEALYMTEVYALMQ